MRWKFRPNRFSTFGNMANFSFWSFSWEVPIHAPILDVRPHKSGHLSCRPLNRGTYFNVCYFTVRSYSAVSLWHCACSLYQHICLFNMYLPWKCMLVKMDLIPLNCLCVVGMLAKHRRALKAERPYLVQNVTRTESLMDHLLGKFIINNDDRLQIEVSITDDVSLAI